MSLQFVLGKSGYGKSTYVQKRMIEEAACHRENDYLMIVPDQFTMQTQKELATMHPSGGILNVDVLSFGRLSHRVLEEVDCREIPVLDDDNNSSADSYVITRKAEITAADLRYSGSSISN